MKIISIILKLFNKCTFDKNGYCKFSRNVRAGSKAEHDVLFYED